MNKLFITENGAVLLNTDTQDAKAVQGDPYQSVRRVYLADEDMSVIYRSGTRVIETNAKAGQIIVEFISNSVKNKLVVVDSLDWADSIKHARKEDQALKERWAAEKAKYESES